jgi:hypothetical protein
MCHSCFEQERNQCARNDARSSNNKQHRSEIESTDSNMLIFQEMKRFKVSQEAKHVACETQIKKPVS